MAFMDWFTGANPAASVAQGAVTGILDGVGKAANGLREAITGKLDADGQAAFELKWQELTQALQIGQQSINLADAQSGSNFRGGWRPAIGWVSAVAIFFYYIPPIAMATLLWTIQCGAVMYASSDIAKTVLPVFPISLDPSDIMGLVASLLGLAGMRSYDKKQGNA